MKLERPDTVTLIGWLLVVAVTVGTQVARFESHESDAEVIRAKAENNSARISRVETDLRVLESNMARQEKAADRMDETVTTMDRLVVELKTIVEAGRGN